jgi:ABC-2 type transport system ATP-binding protein
VESTGTPGNRIGQPPGVQDRMPPLGAGPADSTALVVQGVSKSYGNTKALTNVSLTIPKGSVYALVGPNGSGKTTLFNLITGLIRPDSGTITVMGSVVRPGALPSDRLGIVPEGFALYDYMTVSEHAHFAGQFSRFWDEDFVQRSLVNLDLTRSAKVGHLSQGRRAQLALILALGQRPDLLILDEPTANLDPIVRREVHRMVIGEASARGRQF